MQVKDVLDSEDELIERTHLNDMYNIQYKFLEYEHLVVFLKETNSASLVITGTKL